MNMAEAFEGRNDHLQSLPSEFYQGQAYVHWAMTIQDRKKGWLLPIFYYKFREILTHTAFRFGLCCPIYCCMPDHVHLLWIGLFPQSNQLQATRFFRRQLNPLLEKLGCRLQREFYDRVLHEEQRERSAFENVVEYIARNPERTGLIKGNGYRDYPFTGCLVPGYPELSLWDPDFWDRFGRIYAALVKKGLIFVNTDGEI